MPERIKYNTFKMIDTLNSSCLTISRKGCVFKVYYFQKEKSYFGYLLNDEGILPIKSNNNKEIVDFINTKLNETDGDVNVHFKYSKYLPKKNKNEIHKLIKSETDFNYYNISKVVRLIKN